MIRFIRTLLTKNIGLKALSLVFAVLLWYLAAGQEKTEVGYIIPVDLANLPETVAIEGSSLEFVHVRLRGSRSTIQNLTPQQIQARLNLAKLVPGDNYIAIGQKDLILPKGVELVGVSPPYLYVKGAARRLVPIRVTTRGRPAEGYRLTKLSAIPNKIYVIGSQHRVREIKEVITYPISIRGASSSILAKADLVPPDPEVRLMELKPTEVHIIVEGPSEEKIIRNVPVLAHDGATALFRPARVAVTVVGPVPLVADLTEKNLTARAEQPATGISLTANRKVSIEAPEGVTVLRVEPAEVVELPSAQRNR